MSIRSEALPYVFPGALLAAAAGALGQPLTAVVAASASAALAAFFRDPERAAVAEASAVLSPADGRVVEMIEDDSGLEIAVFLSVFNVHVTRAPVSGALLSWDTISGGYAMAFRPRATHNARSVLRIAGRSGAVGLSLIAGAVARRVVPWVGPGEVLERGQRIALIKFGSRAELRLPAGSSAVVSVGDRVRAGETVIAHTPSRSERTT